MAGIVAACDKNSDPPKVASGRNEASTHVQIANRFPAPVKKPICSQ